MDFSNSSQYIFTYSVFPAQAGIHVSKIDSRLRGKDAMEACYILYTIALTFIPAPTEANKITSPFLMVWFSIFPFTIES